MGNQLPTAADTDGHTEILVALRPKQESFAQAFTAHGNATRAYRESFDCAAMKPAHIRQCAYELVHDPAVAARIRQLYAQAAKGTTISTRARMVRLQEITEADPAELARVVTEPCCDCWADDLVLAAAIDRGLIFDTSAPRDDCPGCYGNGVQRVIVTPTDQLSPSARRLLKAVRQKSDGSIEVVMHDQLAASDQLNRMAGVYVDKSVSVNANVNIPVPETVTAADALAFLKSLTPS
jgi:hypothetical protein